MTHEQRRVCLSLREAALEHDIAILRAALEWYASPRTWNQWLPDVAGNIARAALIATVPDDEMFALCRRYGIDPDDTAQETRKLLLELVDLATKKAGQGCLLALVERAAKKKAGKG
jgi:hypothetical protein